MSGIAGLRGTGDWGTDERPKAFRESILFYSPNGNAPIFALTAKAGKRTVTDPEFAWWAESQTLTRLVVSGALVSTDTTITVSSVDPTSTTMSALYGSATNLKPGDILLKEPATDNATYNQEFLEVDTVISDTQFTVKRGAGGSSAASIADGAGLTLIGSAFAEGTAAPRAVSRNPVKFKNYIQIFKDSYELTGTAAETTVRTGNPWSNDKKRKMFDHAKSIELALLFGRQAEVTGSNGKPQRFMGGLREFIPAANTTVFGAPVTAASFSDALAPAFNFDLGGGDTRIAFCGNTARTEIGKVVQGATGIKIELGDIVRVFGIDFQEFILPMGRVLLKSHPLLSQHPLYKKSLFLLDFSVIKYTTQKGRPDSKVTDDVQLKDEDVRRGYIQTDCSLTVDGGGLSQAYLGNISAT
jgi:hypothetical protein